MHVCSRVPRGQISTLIFVRKEPERVLCAYISALGWACGMLNTVPALLGCYSRQVVFNKRGAGANGGALHSAASSFVTGQLLSRIPHDVTTLSTNRLLHRATQCRLTLNGACSAVTANAQPPPGL